MKFFSWNVNGLRAVINKGQWQRFLDKYQPDILGLQEIKAKADQIDENLSDGYYKYFNSAERAGYAGTAIFSKIKPEKVDFDLPESIVTQFNLDDARFGHPNREGRVITAEFKEFYFVTVYTPNAKSELERLDLRQVWDQAFLAYLKLLEQNKPVVVCGDLNVAHQEIDLARPKDNTMSAGFTAEERAGFQKIIDADLLDTFRQINPDKLEAYTWWSWRARARERNVGWRIDYFLISKSLQNKLQKAEIHAEQLGSDHCPVSVEMDFHA